jgi:hypothetical protein
MRSCAERWARPTTRASFAPSRRWSARVQSGASTWATARRTTRWEKTITSTSVAIRAGALPKCRGAFSTMRRPVYRRARDSWSRAISSCSAGSARGALGADLDPDSALGGRAGSAQYHHFLRHSGAVAQLGARLTGSQKVRGSNPLGSTKCSVSGPPSI